MITHIAGNIINVLCTLGISSNVKNTGIRSKIHQKIKDGDKTRTQAFEGTVIARKHGNEAGGTITVRKVSGGIGVEKIFPIHLPSIERVAVLKKTTGRRSKLYYLRDKSAKEIRRKIGQESVVSQAE